MNFRMAVLGVMIVSLPVAVEVPDSTDRAGGETRISLIGGAGHYAIIDRGCSGEVLRRHPGRFSEVGAAIEHRFARPVAVGVRAGTIENRRTFRASNWDPATGSYHDTVITAVRQTRYLNPFVGIEGRGAGIGAGWMVRDPRSALPRDLQDGSEQFIGRDVSFHVRLGREDRTHFRLSHQEGVPLWTGGQMLEMGFGSRPSPRCDLFVGLSGGEPFDGPGLGLKADFRVAPHWLIAARARLAQSGGAGQNAIAFGLTYSSRPPATPPPRVRSEADIFFGR